MSNLQSALKESVRLAKAGKRPKRLLAFVGEDIECETTAGGEFILPTDQGLCVDLLYRARERRLSIQRECERIEALESALKNHFVETLSASSTGLAGRVARVQIELKAVPQIEDYEKFYAYVKKYGAFDLLQKRLNEGAAKERLEAGDGARAGLAVFRAKKVSITKI